MTLSVLWMQTWRKRKGTSETEAFEPSIRARLLPSRLARPPSTQGPRTGPRRHVGARADATWRGGACWTLATSLLPGQCCYGTPERRLHCGRRTLCDSCFSRVSCHPGTPPGGFESCPEPWVEQVRGCMYCSAVVLWSRGGGDDYNLSGDYDKGYIS